ncbi:MAG TPA: GreA/GreB family elongation factor [Elusimicrobiota bacterium]|nr:GreA/GreB family elongation factor [Elusimicrobiota bacterium]HNI57510.1 GreA/GreB family elongation factor [Elusimicrobiota bacterium]
MSRAFTKEDDAGEDLPEKPVSRGPNYVTPEGLKQLQDAARALGARRTKALAKGDDVKAFDRDLRYLEARIGGAIVVPPGAGVEVRFGASVSIEDESGRKQSFKIVGEDEARAGGNLLAWSSPLAQALFGAKAGDAATLKSGEGTKKLRVLSVSYETIK